jgi:hypothetical protein
MGRRAVMEGQLRPPTDQSEEPEFMCSQPPVSWAGCQGRSSVLRPTSTAGHRCPTCTTISGATLVADMPGTLLYGVLDGASTQANWGL